MASRIMREMEFSIQARLMNDAGRCETQEVMDSLRASRTFQTHALDPLAGYIRIIGDFIDPRSEDNRLYWMLLFTIYGVSSVIAAFLGLASTLQIVFGSMWLFLALEVALLIGASIGSAPRRQTIQSRIKSASGDDYARICYGSFMPRLNTGLPKRG